MIEVAIAEDHQMFTDGVAMLLSSAEDIHLLSTAQNGQLFLKLLEEQVPDVALIDLSMPVMDGEQTINEMKKHYPQVKVIVLTMHDNPLRLKKLMQQGIAGYVLKEVGKQELLNAIRIVYAGSTYFSQEVMQRALMEEVHQGQGGALTKREIEVLRLIGEEYTTQQIAEKLFISTFTVDTHRKNLLSKLQVKNTVGLIKYALEQKIL